MLASIRVSLAFFLLQYRRQEIKSDPARLYQHGIGDCECCGKGDRDVGETVDKDLVGIALVVNLKIFIARNSGKWYHLLVK